MLLQGHDAKNVLDVKNGKATWQAEPGVKKAVLELQVRWSERASVYSALFYCISSPAPFQQCGKLRTHLALHCGVGGTALAHSTE